MVSGKHMESGMHKEPKGGKKLAVHEAKESAKEEMSEKQESGAHLKHPQVASELGDHLTNDCAHFLHHPQLAPEHSQWKAEGPKGAGFKK